MTKKPSYHLHSEPGTSARLDGPIVSTVSVDWFCDERRPIAWLSTGLSFFVPALESSGERTDVAVRVGQVPGRDESWFGASAGEFASPYGEDLDSLIVALHRSDTVYVRFRTSDVNTRYVHVAPVGFRAAWRGLVRACDPSGALAHALIARVDASLQPDSARRADQVETAARRGIERAREAAEERRAPNMRLAKNGGYAVSDSMAPWVGWAATATFMARTCSAVRYIPRWERRFYLTEADAQNAGLHRVSPGAVGPVPYVANDAC